MYGIGIQTLHDCSYRQLTNKVIIYIYDFFVCSHEAPLVFDEIHKLYYLFNVL